MRRFLPTMVLLFGLAATSSAQITKVSSNTGLSFLMPFGNKALLLSPTERLWITDATAAGTFQLSAAMEFMDESGLLNDRFIFAGSTPLNGSELWISDGTEAGTRLLKDIVAGPASSNPDGFVALNGFLYFTAVANGFGRELWRTDGTEAGTTMVKDIVPGPADMGFPGIYTLFSNGSYLLMGLTTPDNGYELWKSDGTADGTVLLKDINPGTASSTPGNFARLNNIVLFTATTAQNGIEVWRTDGTGGGTFMLKDIRPGTASATNFFFPYIFNGKAIFIANNGTTGDELWTTDGSSANTHLLKDIQPGILGSFPSIYLAQSVGSKFIFTAYNEEYDVELWESDGTTTGTKLFKEIAVGPHESGMPFILPTYGFGSNSQPLFQGNKFFFWMVLPNVGTELWVSDGTSAGTRRVKNINPSEDDDPPSISYSYTQSGLYFVANNGVHGDELWKSDGTEVGTNMIADVNPGGDDSDIFFSFYLVNGKLMFEANDGDHTEGDVFRIDANEVPLPLNLIRFTVSTYANDALLQWSTSREVNTKDFTIQRSVDGMRFTDIGSVAAKQTPANTNEYSFKDAGIIRSGNQVVYYRLRMNDNDGKSLTSRVITLRVGNNKHWSIKLNSNPVVGDLGFTLAGITQPVQVSIQDLAGKTIYAAPLGVANGQLSIPAAKLNRGMYLLVAESNRDRKVLRFIKQ